MSSWPTPSALDHNTQAFPVLTAAQINRIRPCGTLRKVEPGEILFQPGDTEVPFYVLLSGSMEIVQPDLNGERPITKHDPGNFTGEITWRDRETGETSTHNMRHVFIMAGASPRTTWLQGCLALDDKGFILTGRDLDASSGLVPPSVWPLTRPPQMLETSLPGVFAVGDVRAGNVKRVASAVGEGAIAIHLVHRTLAEL